MWRKILIGAQKWRIGAYCGVYVPATSGEQAKNGAGAARHVVASKKFNRGEPLRHVAVCKSIPACGFPPQKRLVKCALQLCMHAAAQTGYA